MAKKTKTSSKKQKTTWESIGEMIGKKLEQESRKRECAPWQRWAFYHRTSGNGFLGRLLFVIGVLMLLSHLGIMEGVSTWVYILIGAGFALMRF